MILDFRGVDLEGRRSAIRPGDIFLSTSTDLGPGKAVDNGPDGTLVLEFFDHPSQPAEKRHRVAVPRFGLRRFEFSIETRVFWKSDIGWRSGRVLQVTSQRDVFVRGYEWEGFIPEADLFVRWQRPLEDPVGFAAGGLLESPLLADRRRPFLQHLLAQRSACRGLGALLSSSIQLHKHQIEIARRVLDDPIQRYLLADEVGLGKTIEAGLVIRQLLLDHPALTVQMILPPFLIDQWHRELRNKFHTHEFRASSFRWGRDDEPESWAAADLLVVDEAHNLCGGTESADPMLRERYLRLRQISLESPRLLLLSATPVLHNESAVLAMFHLLDPQVFPQGGVDALRQRVAVRAEVGRILLGLRSDVPAVLLSRRLQELKQLFPADGDLEAIADKANAASEAQEQDIVDEAVSELRVHMSEVYRLNRRMLRTRRTSALEGTYRVTGRSVPDLVTQPGEWRNDTDAALEVWRQERLAEVESDPVALSESASRLAVAVAASSDPIALTSWAKARFRDARGTGDRRAAEALLRLAERVDVMDDVAWPLADELSYMFSDRDRMVIFSPSSDFAFALEEAFADLLGRDAVVTHLTTSAVGDADDAVKSLEDRTSSARVLICDRSAEEGRNLQFADVLVHIGLPSVTNRLEQRIGRFDRWEMTSESASGWRSILIDTADVETMAGGWRRVLTEGFRVFERSIASLQQVAEDETKSAWVHLFTSGIDAVPSVIESVSQGLEEELQRIREQDALDAIEAVHDDRSLYTSILGVEKDEAVFGRIADDLLASEGAGNLRFTRYGSPTSTVGEYRMQRSGRSTGAFPLIPTWRLIRDFVPLDGHVGTFIREVAVESNEVHTYRFGDRFIDSVADFLWNDDRGRAWGMWRHIPDWPEAEKPWFRADFHIEATTDALAEAIKRLDVGAEFSAVVRRADGFFPPLVLTVWLDPDGNRPSSREVEVLASPYDKWRNVGGRDYNLSHKRIEWVHPILPADQWARTWRLVEEHARAIVLERSDFAEAIDHALKQAERLLNARVHQLTLRQRVSSTAESITISEQISAERAINDALLKALENPDVRLDSIGLVVLSSEVPGLEAV